jgi:hypothetical protein
MIREIVAILVEAETKVDGLAALRYCRAKLSVENKRIDREIHGISAAMLLADPSLLHSRTATAEAVPAKVNLRYRWLDQVRGTTVLYLAVCHLIHWPQSNRLVEFFFYHAGRTAAYMTFRDIITAALIFIMGLLYGYGFQRYKKRTGLAGAINQLFFRYGLILLLGIVASFVGRDSLLESRTMDAGGTITVIVWDVLQTIGLVGLVGLPFLFLNPKGRLFAGYLMVVFYQAMLLFADAGWKSYAIHSTHGGILGALFSFSSQFIIASAVGEYYFANVTASKFKMDNRLVLFAMANLAVGLALAIIPGMEASKRQVSLSYSLICMGVTTLACMIFVFLERRDKTSSLLDAFGKNPLLIYIITVGLEFAVYRGISKHSVGTQLIIGALTLVAVTWLAAELHRRYDVIKTERVALVAFVAVLIAVVVRIGLKQYWA